MVEKDIIKSFHNLLRLIPSDGRIIINKNDLNIKKLLKIGCWSKVISLDIKEKNGDFNLIKGSEYEVIAKKKKYKA